jgi:hypothetical protein
MQKQSYANLRPVQFGEAALAASRKVWLAGLGATAVSRDWLQTEGGLVFRTLVKEGTVVESRAIRFVGDRVEWSFDRANAAWKQTRRVVQSTVKQAADTVVDYAQIVMPRSLPTIEMPKPAAPVKRARKAAKRATKRTKAAAKRAAR